MTGNDEAYAGGLLNRALDPSTQPPEIQAFLQAEIDLLTSLVAPGMSVLDVGCGTGRHLARLRGRVGPSVGVDYEHAYIAEAHRAARGPHVHFVTGDATKLPLRPPFDLAICMTNTWGTMSDKAGVLGEMRRLVPRGGQRVLSVYADTSVAARRAWYPRLGHDVIEETPEYLVASGGFRSEHFTEARLRAIVGDCTVEPLAGIAWIVRF